MMKSYIRLEFIGNLAAKPELKTIPVKNRNGEEEQRTVVNGRIAVNTGDNSAIWYKFELWGKRAEAAAQHLDKGSRVFVSDAEPLDPDTWVDKEGKVRAENRIRINDWHWLDTKKDTSDN